MPLEFLESVQQFRRSEGGGSRNSPPVGRGLMANTSHSSILSVYWACVGLIVFVLSGSDFKILGKYG